MHVLHYLVLLSAVNWDSVESKSEDHSLRSKIVFFIKTVTVLYIFFREFEEVNKRTFSLQENLPLFLKIKMCVDWLKND